MGAYEDWIEYFNNLPEEERRKMEEEINVACRRATISSGASKLVHDGFFYEDHSPARVNPTNLFDEGEHYVYVWKHINGNPFYVGSGKKGRSKSISSNRPGMFYAELFGFDAILCYLAYGVSEKEARFIEHYCSFSLSSKGVKLTNRDSNVFYMTEKSKANQKEFFERDKIKTMVLDERLDYLLNKKDKEPEYYKEVVLAVWRDYGTLFHLTMNGNYARAIEALDKESPQWRETLEQGENVTVHPSI